MAAVDNEAIGEESLKAEVGATWEFSGRTGKALSLSY